MSKGQGYKPFSDWSEKRKENHIKYDQENYSVIGTKMPRAVSDSFRVLCKDQGISVSAALSQYVRAALAAGSLDIIRRDIPDQKNETPGTVGIPENASD